jgi:EAL domain-containing protein (putative c-di-GMP-specific phosphodiesterase class I)
MENAVARGYHLVLDDFGTGYSSLSYLRRLPINTLKLDRSFVQEVVTDPGSAAIVAAVVQMARAFGVKVVAEGIESADIRAALAAIGCDLGQGYYFARPMTVLQLAELLEQPSSARE